MGVRTSAVAALLVGTLFTVGCDSSVLPTSPTSEPLLAVSSVSETAQPASVGSTIVLSIPVSFTIQPGAKALIQACVGEGVLFDGESRLVAHQTTLPDGSIVIDNFHFNGQGAVAIGETTGDTYHVVGADANPIVFSPSGTLAATFAAQLLVTGPGSSKSFMAHIIQHITITADGDVTALIELASIECR